MQRDSYVAYVQTDVSQSFAEVVTNTFAATVLSLNKSISGFTTFIAKRL